MEGAAEAEILVVDDDHVMRTYVERVLQRAGFRCHLFENAHAALSFFGSGDHDVSLILSDIEMKPGMSGIEFLQTVKAVAPEIPVILLSGRYERFAAISAMKIGAADYLLKPAMPADIVELVRKHLPEPGAQLRMAVRSALTSVLQVLQLSGADPVVQLVPLLDSLGMGSFETLQHCQRVASFARVIGERHGLAAGALRDLEIGGLLHDIGHTAIPHNILLKQGTLTDEDKQMIRSHTLIGADLLSSIPGIGGQADVVRCHHERFDGTGYPLGISGHDIPLAARLAAVADALDRIWAGSGTHAGTTLSRTRQEVLSCSGTHFDPAVVESFMNVPDGELEDVRRRFADPVTSGAVLPALVQ